MRRRTLPTIAVATLLVTLAASSAALSPAAGAEPAGATSRLVAPGVELVSFARTVGTDRQEVRLLRFRLDDPRLSLRPILAADHGASRRTVTDLVLRSDALAAVNGNFFASSGNVHGIAVRDGVLRSEPEAAVGAAGTPRAAWRVDGDSLAFGRPRSTLSLMRGPDAFGLNGLDRVLGYLGNPDETVVVTPQFGPATRTPATGVDVVVAGIDEVHADTPLDGTVTEVRTGPGSIPVGSAVLTATGNNAADLSSRLAVGDDVQMHIDIDDAGFAAAIEAGGGGPWLVHDSNPVGREAMLAEGFSPTHLDMKAPRTAVGLTGDGRALLVTIDGRQPGRSTARRSPAWPRS